jgi:hypothetical protein
MALRLELAAYGAWIEKITLWITCDVLRIRLGLLRPATCHRSVCNTYNDVLESTALSIAENFHSPTRMIEASKSSEILEKIVNRLAAWHPWIQRFTCYFSPLR